MPYFTASARLAEAKPGLKHAIIATDRLLAELPRCGVLALTHAVNQTQLDRAQLAAAFDLLCEKGIARKQDTIACNSCETSNSVGSATCSGCERPLTDATDEPVYVRTAEPDAPPPSETPVAPAKSTLPTAPSPTQPKSSRFRWVAVAVIAASGLAVAVWGIKASIDNNGTAAHRDENGCYDAMFSASRSASSGAVDLVTNFKKDLRARTGTAAEGFTEYKNIETTPAMQACDRFCALWARSKGNERERFMSELVKCLGNFSQPDVPGQ